MFQQIQCEGRNVVNKEYFSKVGVANIIDVKLHYFIVSV